MENNNQNDRRDDNLSGKEQNTKFKSQNASESNEAKSDKPDSGSESESENDNTFHQRHGNRKYESHSNHSSADDQPGTTTDTHI